MKWLLIGHRGTGKTSLLQRLQEYFPETATYDLDYEISKKTGCTVDEYFAIHGELSFRQIELQTLNELIHKNPSFIISCGAGLQIEEVKGEIEKIWIRRPTDASGRIFLDRPRLNKELGPLEEYHKRYKERTIRFQKVATEIVDISEGFDFITDFEKDFFKQTFDVSDWTLTLQTQHLQSPEKTKDFLAKRIAWGLQIELRDDLLTKEQIHRAILLIPKSQALISFRQKEPSKDLIQFAINNQIKTDWDLDLGTPPFEPYIVSLHQANTLTEGLQRLSQYPNAIQKAAFRIDTIDDLLLGDEWLHDHSKRAFLPRSESGLWKWYRLYRSEYQAIQFLADHIASQVDQPSILEVLKQQEYSDPQSFAAVLGSPIFHSLSPATHFEFFLEYNIPFYAIEPSDWNIKGLQQLGLRFAAVTAPFKEKAYASAEKTNTEVDTLKNVNTLILNELIEGFNTDLAGIQKLLETAIKPVAIWGGGAMIRTIQSYIPTAASYSSRTGETKTQLHVSDPKTVIWAAPRSQFEKQGVYPPDTWKPELVIDVNYTEDSPGRIYAQMQSCNYISGMTLFKEQAKKQQEIWSQYL